MSTKKKILAVVALLIIAGVAFLLWRRSQPATASKAQPPAASNASAGATTPPSPPPTQNPRLGLNRVFQTLNHNPIKFYGRAVDQYGDPVPAAEVMGMVLFNTGARVGEKPVTTTTDVQGYFQFTDIEGQDLGIGFKKEGYEYNSYNSSFSYSYFEADHKRHIPDPKNPVVFTLWKGQDAEALVQYHREWRFPVNEGSVRINLETGKMGQPEADLIVTISRNPLRMPYGTRGFAWKATVEVVDGGLIRAGKRDYYNLAPESGHVPRLEQVQEAQNPNDYSVKWTWEESIKDTFFISSRHGKNIARVHLYIRPNIDRREGDNEALVGAGVWLNPNGGRNLEFDPAKAIRPKP